MNKDNAEEDFIAERQWEYRISAAEKHFIPVKFTRPKQGTRGKLWRASFLIFWPDGKIIERAVLGTDQVDALIQVIELFRIECKKVERKMGDSVTFDATPSLYGYEKSSVEFY